MSHELLEVLKTTLSHNKADQTRAEEYLKQAATANLYFYCQELSVVLKSEIVEPHVRQAAGLQLKNVLHAKEEETRIAYLQRWLNMPLDIRTSVKGNVLAALGTETSRPSTAAQCVASIACAELPQNKWPDVINVLMTNVTSPTSTESKREASLESLGYICQDIDPKILEGQANSILTAIVHGMRKEETSNHVKLAATTALFNALEFTSNNFQNEQERNLIMQVVCQATQLDDLNIKVAALQCLVRIMTLYYQLMEAYMQHLYSITVNAIKSPEDNVALQGIEFWSNVCEEEISLAMEAEEAQENNKAPTRVSRYYAKGATPHLCPLLLEALAKQEEGDDDDDWTPHKAAGVCIMLLSQCVGDDIIPCVLPFFAHFQSNNWKYKEAAIMAFGSILDGPDPAKLQAYIEQAFPLLVAALSDGNVEVRDSTAWTIGRILEICPEIAGNPGLLQALLPAFSQGLGQEPRVAANICWALMALVRGAYELGKNQGTDSSGEPETFVLSGIFSSMIAELIKVTDRPDGNQSNLRLAAFETLMELIKNSPKDCYPVVQETTIIMLQKLDTLLQLENTALAADKDKNALADLQSLLCATLQSVLRKVRPEDAPKIANPIMNGLLQIMNRAVGKSAGSTMEEALLAVSALAETLNEGFSMYIDSLRPHLLRALTNYEDAQVCVAAAGLTGDICRCMNDSNVAVLDEIMEQLVRCLRESKLARDAKVQIIGNFGDIAMAIGTRFSRYTKIIMDMLAEAAETVVTDVNDYDQVDYVNSLRENIILAYVGILQSMCPDGYVNNASLKQQAQTSVRVFAEQMIALVMRCCDSAPDPTDALIGSVAGLIGDLVTLYGSQIINYFVNEKVDKLLTRGRRSKTSKVKSVSTWATKEIRKTVQPSH